MDLDNLKPGDIWVFEPDSATTDEMDEQRVHLIGQLYEALNYRGDELATLNSFRLEAVQIIVDSAATDERLLHRLVAIDGRNGCA